MNAALAAMITRAASWPDTCESGVSRKGDYVPCDKPAIGIRINEDDELAPAGTYAWPVCVHHARKNRMVPLRDLLEWQGRTARTYTAAQIFASVTGDTE